MRNILQINDMIDMLDDFIAKQSARQIIVGGMAGTSVFKMVMDSILLNHEFKEICIIEGCQDYMGLTDPMSNHMYYMDTVYEETIIEEDVSHDYYLTWGQAPKYSYLKHLNLQMIGHYNFLVINDLQLIPYQYVKILFDQFPGKIIGICDPFEAGKEAEKFIGCPTVVDTLSKTSTIVALARRIYNVGTRGIDRKVKCSVIESRIGNRSIGRIGERQFITNNMELAHTVWDKQIASTFHKGQKLLVNDDRVYRVTDKNGNKITLGKNSLLVIDAISLSSTKLKLRVWSSKSVFESDVSYLPNPPCDTIYVRPANVLFVDEVQYHRYQNAALVTSFPLSSREKYTILKNTNNLMISEKT